MSLRTVRKLAGLLLLAALVYVGWLLSKVDRRPSAKVQEQQAAPGEVPVKPEEESGCFDDLVLDWGGDRLEAGRACKQPDGFSNLERVVLHLRREDGTEQMVVRADKGRTAEAPGEPIELTGRVHVETPQGLILDSEQLRVDKAAHQVRSEVPVTFSRGDLSGSGGRMVHDWENGRTELEGEPVLTLRGERTEGREVTLRGARLDFEQASRRLQATGAAVLDFGDGTISGQRIDVKLADDQEAVEAIEATGGAATRTLLTAPGATGAPSMDRTLRGERIAHEFASGGVLRRVTAGGGARLDGASRDPALGITELLEGTSLELGFSGQPLALSLIAAQGAPARFRRDEPAALREVTGADLRLDGGSAGFERLQAKGDASVRDDTSAVKRLLRADSADMTLVPGGNRLDALRFEGRPGKLVEEVLQPEPGRRTVSARRGDLRFDETGRPVEGTLGGSVEILDAGTRASADDAIIERSPRRTVLKGKAAVEREGRTSHGDEIVRDDAAGTLTVTGNQHTLVRDAKGMPGMQAEEGDEPVLISSDVLVLHEAARRAEYEGGRVSLRRGDTELVADRLVLDDAAGTLDATGKVESKLRLAKPGSTAATDAPFDPSRLVDGSAEEFHYRRADRLVRYEKDASLAQDDTLLTAGLIDVRLTATEPAQVETLEAVGDAFFKAPSRGEAEGEKLLWQAADDSVRVTGGARPARALDAQGNFQTGAVVEMTKTGVRALASSAGRARGSSPTLKAPAP